MPYDNYFLLVASYARIASRAGLKTQSRDPTIARRAADNAHYARHGKKQFLQNSVNLMKDNVILSFHMVKVTVSTTIELFYF